MAVQWKVFVAGRYKNHNNFKYIFFKNLTIDELYIISTVINYMYLVFLKFYKQLNSFLLILRPLVIRQKPLYILYIFVIDF